MRPFSGSPLLLPVRSPPEARLADTSGLSSFDEWPLPALSGSPSQNRALPLSALSRPASLTKNSRRTPRSPRFALDHSRVVEIVLDRLAGKGGRGHQRHALRRAKPVPRPLWDDSHHSRAECARLRPLLSRDVQRRHAIEDMDQLVCNVLFPMTFPRELRGGEGAVTVGRQSSGAPR